MHAAHELGATIELAEPQVDTLLKETMEAAEKLRKSEKSLQQRAQSAATAMRGQLAEFAAALREESGMSFRGGDFKEMAQLANINRRRTARAAVSVRDFFLVLCIQNEVFMRCSASRMSLVIQSERSRYFSGLFLGSVIEQKLLCRS